MMNEAVSHYLKGGYTVLALAVSVCKRGYRQTTFKLIRFYLTILQFLKQYRYPQLLLDVLGVTENEMATVESHSEFVEYRLRIMALQSLSQADEIMTLQNEVAKGGLNKDQKLLPPLLQCIAFCEKLGFRRKKLLFMDRVELRKGYDIVGTIC